MNGFVSSVSLALVAALLPGALQPGPTAAPIPAPIPALAVVPAPCDDAYLGVYVSPTDAGGAEVTRLMQGSPAEEAGIQPGDRIVALGGEAIADPDALIASIDERSAGDRVEVVVRRGEDKHIFTLDLGNRAESDLPGKVELGVMIPLGLPSTRSPIPVDTDLEPILRDGDRFYRVPRAAAAPPDGGGELQQRLDELHARMEERWAAMNERLESFRSEHGREDGAQERIQEFRRDMQRTRAEQQRRMDELGESVREAAREAARARAGMGPGAPGTPGPRREAEDRPGLPVRVPLVWRNAPAPQPTPALRSPAPAPDAPASAAEVRALHDEVRALRREIGELRELLSGGR